MCRLGMMAIIGLAVCGGTSSLWAQQAGAGTQGAAGAQNQAGAAAGAQNQAGTAAAAQNQAGVAGQAQAGAQLGAMNRGINQTPWFANQQVRQQLQLNDQQFNQLNQLYQDQYTQYKRELGDALDTDLTPEQRQQQIANLQQQFRQGFQENYSNRFSDAQFTNRFNQLNMQYQGYDAFSNPALQQQLNLTPAQQQQLQSLSADWNAEMTRLSQANPANRRQLQMQLNRMRQAGGRQLRTILSRDQFQDWDQMVGDPFEFPADAYFSNLGTGQTRTGQAQQGAQSQPQQGTQSQTGQQQTQPGQLE